MSLPWLREYGNQVQPLGRSAILERKQINVVNAMRAMSQHCRTCVMPSKIDLMKEVVLTVRQHFEAVVVWAQNRQNNGLLEALNDLFQGAKDRAGGFTRISTIRTVIFVIARKLQPRMISAHVGRSTQTLQTVKTPEDVSVMHPVLQSLMAILAVISFTHSSIAGTNSDVDPKRRLQLGVLINQSAKEFPHTPEEVMIILNAGGAPAATIYATLGEPESIKPYASDRTSLEYRSHLPPDDPKRVLDSYLLLAFIDEMSLRRAKEQIDKGSSGNRVGDLT